MILLEQQALSAAKLSDSSTLIFYQGENVSSRVVAVQGDIELPGLGLSDEDKATLSSQVISLVGSLSKVHFLPFSHRLRWSYTAQQQSDLTRTSVQPSA